MRYDGVMRGKAGKAEIEMDAVRDHESDFVGWTERQAAILRSLPGGTFGLDTINLAEEIADVGRSEIRETSSLLRQVLVHLIKLAARPDSAAADHWVDEVLAFQGDAVLACTPGIRQRIELERLWQLACNAAARSLARRGDELGALPAACPLTLDDLLAVAFDPLAAAGRIAAASGVRPPPARP
jgi:hypothetical protein